jgi:hypothetical protein
VARLGNAARPSKAGNRLPITAQLIDSAIGGHIWAEHFDRDLNNIFSAAPAPPAFTLTSLAVTSRIGMGVAHQIKEGRIAHHEP